MSQGLSAEPQKILKVDNWSTPTKRKELQVFMGMVNYLSTYVPHLATVAAPLTRLCGDTVKFKWIQSLGARLPLQRPHPAKF